MTKLKTVTIKNCKVNDKTIRYLSDGIKENSSILNLSITYETMITYVGIEQLAKAICENSTIKNLTLKSVGINDDSIKALINIFNKKNLEKISFAENNEITDDSYYIIREALIDNSSLYEILLTDTNMKQKNRLDIKETLSFNKVLNSIDPLKTKNHIFISFMKDNPNFANFYKYKIDLHKNQIKDLHKKNQMDKIDDLIENQMDNLFKEIFDHKDFRKILNYKII